MRFSRGAPVLPFLPAILAYVPAQTNWTDPLFKESTKNLLEAVEGGTLEKHLATENVPQNCEAGDAAIRKE